MSKDMHNTSFRRKNNQKEQLFVIFIDASFLAKRKDD